MELCGDGNSRVADEHEHDEVSDDDLDSLFDEMESEDDDHLEQEIHDYTELPIATRLAPSIQGLYFDPSILIPQELADDLWSEAIQRYFTKPNVNQIMLFERASETISDGDHCNVRLPAFLLNLLVVISKLLRSILPNEIHDLLFLPSERKRARQAILNLYNPGEGITAHVDLLKRYGDGIIGVSLHGGCVMQFGRVPDGMEVDGYGERPDQYAAQSDSTDTSNLYLPPRSIVVLTGDARYKWTHGIQQRRCDLVRQNDSPDSNSLRMHGEFFLI